MNTLFLFGEPIGMLSGSPPPHAQGFLDAFQEGFNGCGMRIALGPLKVLLPKAGWLKACAKTHAFADVYVDRALEYRKKHVADGDEPATTKQRTLLYNMAQQTGDRTVLRNQIVQAMMAATETTASLVSTVIHVLANRSDVFAKLRIEVLAVGDEPLNFDCLARIKYLQNVITESKSVCSQYNECD
jgi:cytochrome P450